MYQWCPTGKAIQILGQRDLFFPTCSFSDFLSCVAFRASTLDSGQEILLGPTGPLMLSALAGRSAELIVPRSLPPGDYLVPLFIADRQGLAQKQTVHVRICSCPGGSECEERSDPGLLWWVLSPVCAALMALSSKCFLKGAQPLSLAIGQQDMLCTGGRKA